MEIYVYYILIALFIIAFALSALSSSVLTLIAYAIYCDEHDEHYGTFAVIRKPLTDNQADDDAGSQDTLYRSVNAFIKIGLPMHLLVAAGLYLLGFEVEFHPE